MYPHIACDEINGLAYIAFSNHKIENSIELENELFVLDIDKDGELVGIEVLSIARLQESFAQYCNYEENRFSPEMIPAYIMPFLFSSQNVKNYPVPRPLGG